MPVVTIIAFLAGMTVLAFTVIVIETWWAVATVGLIHIVGCAVLMVLLIRQLSDEERRAGSGGDSPHR